MNCTSCGTKIEQGFTTADGDMWACDEICLTSIYKKAYPYPTGNSIFEEIQEDLEEDNTFGQYLLWTTFEDHSIYVAGGEL